MLVLHAISLHVRTYRIHPCLYHLCSHDYFTNHILHDRYFKNKENGINDPGGLLACLYAYIFFLIQLETYALLVGSIGLFVILAIIMYFSQKINWYNNQ